MSQHVRDLLTVERELYWLIHITLRQHGASWSRRCLCATIIRVDSRLEGAKLKCTTQLPYSSFKGPVGREPIFSDNPLFVTGVSTDAIGVGGIWFFFKIEQWKCLGPEERLTWVPMVFCQVSSVSMMGAFGRRRKLESDYFRKAR